MTGPLSTVELRLNFHDKLQKARAYHCIFEELLDVGSEVLPFDSNSIAWDIYRQLLKNDENSGSTGSNAKNAVRSLTKNAEYLSTLEQNRIL